MLDLIHPIYPIAPTNSLAQAGLTQTARRLSQYLDRIEVSDRSRLPAHLAELTLLLSGVFRSAQTVYDAIPDPRLNA